MSFLRRVFGGKQPQPTPDAAAASPAPSKSRGATQRPFPAAPSLADSPPTPLHAYFEYVGGDSSKFYAVSLEEEDGDTWRVRFNFGRIGFPRAWAARVEGVPWDKAASAYMALVDEKTGKGYEIRPWPPILKLPDGTSVDEDSTAGQAERDQVLFRASRRGTLPPARSGSVGGVALADGTLYAPTPEGGSRGDAPVIWASDRPVDGAGRVWSRLAAAFGDTGIWPFVIDASYGFKGFDDYLMDVPRGRHTEVLTVLRKGWNGVVDIDEDDPLEEIEPFGKQFPGLAGPTPGDRATSVDHVVASLSGHLGLVAVNRPADILDAVGWMGAANYDGDPLDMSTVLRSWEVRFDAYVVGLGTDTLNVAVGRPARDLAAATAIAAEHFAFCPDNIQQGAGSIRDYAELLVNAELWPFWWD
jgi:predicted DNA-binding WGR domain protein